jgi:hypothetical protein
LRVPTEDNAGRRQGDMPRRARQQARSEIFFQQFDVTTQRRRKDVHAVSRMSKMQVFGDSDKTFQLFQVHVFKTQRRQVR